MSSAPGVYIKEQNSLSLSIKSRATAVPVLVGMFHTKDGSSWELVDKGCVKIEDWMDFTTKFGAGPSRVKVILTPKSEIQPVDSNKKNKGKQQNDDGVDIKASYNFSFEDWNHSPSVMCLRQYFDNGGGPCYLLPFSNGNRDHDKFPSEIEKFSEISIIAFLAQSGSFLEIHNDEFNSLLQKDKGYFLVCSGQDFDQKWTPSTEPDQTGFYYPYLKSPYKYWRDDSLVTIEGYAEDPTVTRLSHLADVDPELYTRICAEIDKHLATVDVPDLPPSAAVVGAYCRTDRERGVWKAPANVALRGVSGLSQVVSEEEHGELNEKGINVIRWFADRGPVIYGARTLKVDSTDWRYIPVRRLFGSAERDIKEAMQPLIFEPNNAPTWEAARSAIDNYLNRLWRQGALFGDTPAEAYFVRVGRGITMDDTHIRQGIMIVKIGMAAVRPAEFIILEFTQQVGQV